MCTQAEMDDLYEKMKLMFIKPAKSLGMIRDYKGNKSIKKQRRYKKEKWFDDECEASRREYFANNKMDNNANRNEAQHDYISNWKKYKHIIKQKKKIYTKNFHRTVRNLKTHNPKDFWKLINPVCQKKN